MRHLLKLAALGFLLFSVTSCTIVSVNDSPNESLEAQPLSTERRNQIIRSVVFDHKKEILGCYDYELKKQPGLGKGKVVLQWEIGEEGEPESLSIEDEKSTLKIETLNRCLIDCFREMHFPSPVKGSNLRIHYPLVFGEESGSAKD